MNKKKRMNEKQKLMAYVLSTDEDLNERKKITQREIGDLFGYSQPTISSAIKDTRNLIRIRGLERELSEAKQEILHLQEVTRQFSLPDHIDDEYHKMP